MNLIILQPEDFVSPDEAELSGRRFEHIRNILKADTGKICRVGMLGGQLGEGRVIAVKQDSLRLNVTLNQNPPSAVPLTLIFALPRPKTLKKVLHAALSMGVKKIFIIEAWKVDKSYWTTPLLTESGLMEQIIPALEQARDTLLPDIQIRRRFKPFAEDELRGIIGDSLALAAHPGSTKICPAQLQTSVTLCIGPEGGFTDYEIDLLVANGCQSVNIGSRILRTEVAVPALIGRLFANV
ncbi:MAG: 16S rRNA (uracil(1498)-N(3))-methyltransferase [Victivallaceae bacterium]